MSKRRLYKYGAIWALIGFAAGCLLYPGFTFPVRDGCGILDDIAPYGGIFRIFYRHCRGIFLYLPYGWIVRLTNFILDVYRFGGAKDRRRGDCRVFVPTDPHNAEFCIFFFSLCLHNRFVSIRYIFTGSHFDRLGYSECKRYLPAGLNRCRVIYSIDICRNAFVGFIKRIRIINTFPCFSPLYPLVQNQHSNDNRNHKAAYGGNNEGNVQSAWCLIFRQ